MRKLILSALAPVVNLNRIGANAKAYGAAVVVSVALASFCLPTSASAQSFNCDYARTADEVLICQDVLLSSLDANMSSTYYNLRNKLFGWRLARLENIRMSRLAERMECGRDAGCIAAVYRQWIEDMESLED